MHICMYVYAYTNMHIRIYAYKHICTEAHMQAMHVRKEVYSDVTLQWAFLQSIDWCIYTALCRVMTCNIRTCMHIYIHTYISIKHASIHVCTIRKKAYPYTHA